MKREIKFRAWDKQYKVMRDVDMILFNTNEILCNGELGEPKYIEHYELMQFTGLTDKNGKEVYESDITKNPIGKIGIVVFYDGKFRIKIHQSETHFSYIDLSQGFCNNKEIIGNIYENPELL